MLGGILAALTAGLVFVVFFPLPTAHDPRSHLGEAFVVTVLLMFLCGGWVGRSAIRARTRGDLLPPIIGTYIAVVAIGLGAGMDFRELGPPLGFATAGLIASAVGGLLLAGRFPPKRC